MQYDCGAKVLGCHLEGPFISGKYPGAQVASHIKTADFSLIEDYSDVIKMITIAPEIKGSEQFIRRCANENIVVAIGHSSATYEEAVEAFGIGVKGITHIFNAMPPLRHREPGIIGAAMDNKDIYCELIADNIHVHPVLQRILLKSKGVDRIILVTDSMRAAGMPDGCYELGGQTVYVRNGSARLGNGTLAGSVLTIDKALGFFMNNTGISIEDAVRLVTINPASLLGLGNRLGSLRKGLDADITVFNEQFDILFTFVNGFMCYGE